MPAAAVIPAPIAYIKIAAVKKLVVGLLWNSWACTLCLFQAFHILLLTCASFTGSTGAQILYLEKIRVFQASFRLNSLAWNI